jgi:glycosyltransferase involved in cell wall biosynthesis
MPTTLNLLQDLATPHNNALVSALRSQSDLRVVTWYGMRLDSLLPWKEPLGGDHDNHYCDTLSAKLKLASRVLFRRSEKFMAVGYATFGTRFLLIVSWLLRRPFIYWTDLPVTNHRGLLRRWARSAVYWILKRRARPLFVVGNRAGAFFVGQGFPPANVVNLPIFIERPARVSDVDRATIRERYGVPDGNCLAVAASRLDFNKGYDLLLRALSTVDGDVLRRLTVLIVGSGPEQAHLARLTRELALEACVKFEQWLDPAAYARVVGSADVFLHPARFDAFGGGTLYAMAYGVPVIGSEGAGSAAERVVHGENGFLYPPEDLNRLAAHVAYMVTHPDARRAMGDEARLTAESWPPERGAAIIRAALYTA